MTEDKARKIATRQRMAETGEPYSVARRAVEDERASSAGPLGGMAEDAGAAEAQARSQEQAEQARRLAEQARIRAERAEEAADQAEEAADKAGNLAGDSEGGSPRWHHRPSRPATPPRPPRPARPATPPRPPRPPRAGHYGPHGQDDWPQQRPDPAELRAGSLPAVPRRARARRHRMT